MIKRITRFALYNLVKRDDFGSQFQRYRRTFLWLLVSLWRVNYKKFILTVLSSVTGVVLQAGTLGALLYYANLMERNSTFDLLGVSYSARDQSIFAVVLAIAGLILIIGSWFKYFAVRSNFELCVEFAIDCGKRILRQPWLVMDGPIQPGKDRYPPELVKLLTGIRPLARGAKPILNLASPLMMTVYSLAILFYLEPLLTLILISVIAPSLLLQYLINYNATQNEKVLIASSQPASNKIKSFIEDMADHSPGEPAYQSSLDDLYHHPSIIKHLGAYIYRKLATNKSALVSDVLLAILAIGLMVFLGGSALQGDISWTRFLTYLLFARISLVGVRGIFATVTSFARHYSRIRNAYFVVNRKLARRSRTKTISSTLKLNKACGVKKLGIDITEISAGNPVLVLSPTPLTRFNLSFFSYALGQAVGQIGQVLQQSIFCHVRPPRSNRDEAEEGPVDGNPNGLIENASIDLQVITNYLSDDQYNYCFADGKQVDHEAMSNFVAEFNERFAENKFLFICGQSLSDFDLYEGSSPLLVLRPDCEVMAGDLNSIREQQSSIRKWLRKWKKRTLPDDDFEDEDD